MGQDALLPYQGDAPDEIRSEAVTDEMIALYAQQGYVLTFAEKVMRYNLSHRLPRIAVPFECSYLHWEPARVHAFFTVYDAAFRARPGFPGWSEAQWMRWTSGDPTFRPDLSVLAVVQGEAVGFVTNADYGEETGTQTGYIIQIGVHPAWRGRGIGAALTAHALQMWQESGKEAVILDVNVNNPGAIHLYLQLGFMVVRHRGKFSRQVTT